MLGDDVALVQSVDFFTPVVDDPFDFGRAAAANALSDLYAMGARPLSALAVCAFPRDTLGLDVLRRTLAGGLSVLAEDGVVPLGGHTIKGPEFNYGLAVTGLVHPREVLTNAGARPGDGLVLTKPLGTGVLATALKQGALEAALERSLVASMTTTNRLAAEACRASGVRALTDVTGYGLLGHALEMAEASGVTVELWTGALPLLPGAWQAAVSGAIPAGLVANRTWAQPRVLSSTAQSTAMDLLCDPQTSGGLLAAIPASRVPLLLEECHRRGVAAAHVGEVTGGPPGRARILAEGPSR